MGGGVQVGLQASRAANELGRQVVIKEKSPASSLHSAHVRKEATGGLCKLWGVYDLCLAVHLEVCSSGGGKLPPWSLLDKWGLRSGTPDWRQYRFQNHMKGLAKQPAQEQIQLDVGSEAARSVGSAIPELAPLQWA